MGSFLEGQYVPTFLHGNFSYMSLLYQFPIAASSYSYYASQDPQGIPSTSLVNHQYLQHSTQQGISPWQHTPPVALPSLNLDSKEKYIGSDSQGKNGKKRKSSPQQNNRKRSKPNTKIHLVCSGEERQEVFTRISEFISNHFPNASIKSVRQGLHLPSFEKRGVKVNGKCVAITRGFSQALLLHGEKAFLSNLETSAKIYEHIEQHKQISESEKRKARDLENLIYSFEEQLDSYESSSLPLSLIHNTKGDLKCLVIYQVI